MVGHGVVPSEWLFDARPRIRLLNPLVCLISHKVSERTDHTPVTPYLEHVRNVRT
jgi:hypothetical protein